MAIRVGINGFGRIGRQTFRAIRERYPHSLEVVAKETGFRDRRHMREVFIRGFGVPPQAVRRDARQV